MRFAWIASLLLAGCPADDDSGYPIRPGGGGGGGGVGNRPDGPPRPDAGPSLTGRVCVPADPRDWTACMSATAGEIAVTIGSETVTTDGDGFFTFSATPTGATIRAVGDDIVTSIRPFTTGASLNTVAFTRNNWNMIRAMSGFDVTDGNGSVVLELLDNGFRAAGLTGTSEPPPGTAANATVYYDGASFFTWGTVMTGDDSKAIFADLPPGSAQVTAIRGSDMAIATFPVVNDAITFGELDVPPPPP